jgi:hypothetical protein
MVEVNSTNYIQSPRTWPGKFCHALGILQPARQDPLKITAFAKIEIASGTDDFNLSGTLDVRL